MLNTVINEEVDWSIEFKIMFVKKPINCLLDGDAFEAVD